MSGVRYNRAPSPELLNILAPGGLLAPMLAPRTVCALALDVQFREKDHVHVYCGLTRLVDARLSGRAVIVGADARYAQQQCGKKLFRAWKLDETGFADALNEFYDGAVVNPRYTRSEGAVQATWAAVRDPWCPIDREGVIGYAKLADQARSRAFAPVAEAQHEVARLAGDGVRWTALKPKRTAAELDQLGIDSEGRLVLIELKHASASASVYYSPLQLLQYVHEWSAVFDVIRDDLGRIQAARVALGLLPASLRTLGDVIRPVIGFGEQFLIGKAQQRFAAVLEVANRYLPMGAAPIEVWQLASGKPRRLP